MSAAYLSINSPILSISFSRMNEANRKVGKAGEEARCEGESLSRAISSLQVSDSRLRMKAEALSSLRSRINRRQGSLQAMGAHIDYAVRRFQEVDNLCAQRIKSNGYECAKLMGLSTQSGIYGSIVSGLNTIVNQGKAAWNYIKTNGNKILDCVQTGLDLIGLIPGLGEIADGINAGIYLLRGDYAGAALSLAAMIPIAGCAATAGKFVYKGLKAYKKAENIVKVIDKAGDLYGIVKKVGNKGIQKVASKAGDVFENISRTIGKKPDLVAEGAGIFKGSIPDFGKVGIPELKETPVQKNFNAIYGNPSVGASKLGDLRISQISENTNGHVIFGELDQLGRPTGVSATITQDMIGTGSKASQSIIPPGFQGGGPGGAGHARGHLIGNQLGGTGKDARNLVTLYQNPVNTPVMRGFEDSVRAAVEGGQVVRYQAIPVYEGTNLIPTGVTLRARGTGGFKLDVSVPNRR